MASPRLQCAGFEIGICRIPPFQINEGEAITLKMPSDPRVDQETILQCLSGRGKKPGLIVHAAVHLAERAAAPSSWLGWHKNQTAHDWLMEHTPLGEDQIYRLLAKHELDANLPLRACAGTPRTLLGLEKAYALGAEVVVFSTAGLDPLGVHRVFRTVSEHVPVCSAIYVAWPYFCQGQEYNDQLPGSQCLSAIPRVALVKARA